MENESLLEECAEWVAAQLEEENILVEPLLVALIMEAERGLGPPRSASRTIATSIEAALEERGVRGAPSAIDATLIYAVLQWEDEFMALAGFPRPD